MVGSRGLEVRVCNGGGGMAAEVGSRDTKQEVGRGKKPSKPASRGVQQDCTL